MNKERFIWLLQNSVKITSDKYPDSIFYYMDKNIERQIKLHKVLDIKKPISLNYNKIDINNIVFKQEIKNNRLWIDYEKIWSKLESNIDYKGLGMSDMSELIGGWLNEDSNWKPYTPLTYIFRTYTKLNDDTNWKPYTPGRTSFLQSTQLNDDTDWKPYTPLCNTSITPPC